VQSRTVLFGGTFDPIHNAHLEIARAAASRFDLRKILFIPAANPPHKSRGAHASYEDRVRMAELACAGEPAFQVSRIEQPSPGHPAKRSYSIDTIEKLQTAGEGPLSFLIGADAFAEITTWHRWHDVVSAVEFIVVTRPGHEYSSPSGARVHRLETVALPVSSSEIRGALARGETPAELPRAVAEYIRDNGLYAT